MKLRASLASGKFAYCNDVTFGCRYMYASQYPK